MSKPSKNLSALQQIQGWIKNELDLETEYLPASRQIPQETVVVTLEPDSQGRARVASITFLPIGGEIEHFDLLQFFMDGPLEISKENEETFLRLVATANQVIPVGAFSLSDENKLIYKYVFPVSKKRGLDPEEFLEIYLLWMFTLDSLSGLVDEVLAGDKDLKTAQEELLS